MQSWKEIILKIAPTIGTALGGPFAGVATKYISERLLGKGDATDEELAQAIQGASPEQLAQLKELDAQFKVDMKKLDIDVYELEYKDRDSARKMFAVNIWPQIIISILFIIVYLAVLLTLISNPTALSTNNQAYLGIITTILGVLTAAIPQILGFWFGSSLGSKEKSQELNVAIGKTGSK